MLSKYNTLLLDDIRNDEDLFDSYREEHYFLEELKQAKKEAKKTVKKVDNAGVVLIKTIKSLYKTDDKHLVEGTMELSKVITRVAVVGGIAYVNPVIGLISFFTALAIRRNNDAKRREKLMIMYKSKLEFVEDKIGRTEDDSKKQSLIKLKHKLNSEIEKLEHSVFKERD
jgi:hypothetical protein